MYTTSSQMCFPSKTRYTSASSLRLMRWSVPSPGIRIMYFWSLHVNKKLRFVIPFFSTSILTISSRETFSAFEICCRASVSKCEEDLSSSRSCSYVLISKTVESSINFGYTVNFLLASSSVTSQNDFSCLSSAAAAFNCFVTAFASFSVK